VAQDGGIAERKALTMSVFTSRPALRWVLPAGVVGIVAATTGGSILAANAGPSLPDRTAAQLLVDLQTSKVDGFSGTVVQKADLGLPALPNVGGKGSSNLTSLVSGAHTLRVWHAGKDKNRLALLGTLGESDVVQNGRDLWLWSSDDNQATHLTLPAATQHAAPSPADLPKTPQEAADRALKAIDPSTKVSTDGAASVAGRDAYELLLTPRDPASKVSQIKLAIDAATKMPLRVEVRARGASAPAFEVGFTQITLSTPGNEHFTFKPPPGAKVSEKAAPSSEAAPRTPKKTEAPDAGPTVIGTGWTSVLVMRNPQPSTEPPAGAPPQARQGLSQLTSIINRLPKVSGSWGSGRLLESTLFSALLTDDGRILIGAVNPDRLYAAAASPQAKVPALKAPR
jgi:outer membrane lipoprotein-sorting protein